MAILTFANATIDGESLVYDLRLDGVKIAERRASLDAVFDEISGALSATDRALMLARSIEVFCSLLREGKGKQVTNNKMIGVLHSASLTI